jgi:isochorismate hydrolase
MPPNVLLVCKPQKAFFNKEGSSYLGQEVEFLKMRMLEYLRNTNLEETSVYYIREVRAIEDNFYSCAKTGLTVGSADIEIPEIFKPFVKFIINTSRYSAFYKTPLDSELSKLKAKKITLIGVSTQDTILYTAEEARNRCLDVDVIEPLVMSEDSYMHSLGIVLLRNSLGVNILNN